MDQALKITQFEAPADSATDELVLVIDEDSPQPARNVLADDQHGIYLRRDLENEQVVGAVIFNAQEWFDQIAEAFAKQDVNNPDVRFFLEKKLESVANGDASSQQTQPPLIPSQ